MTYTADGRPDSCNVDTRVILGDVKPVLQAAPAPEHVSARPTRHSGRAALSGGHSHFTLPSMSRFKVLGVVGGLALIAMTAGAQESPRRSLASCMMKRMTADRAVSYNEAQRMCKEQGKGSDSVPETAANKQTKPVS